MFKKIIPTILITTCFLIFTYAESANWLPLYEGVDYRLDVERFESGQKARIHTMRVDLSEPGVRVISNEPMEVGIGYTAAKRPTSFLREKRAQVAINGLAYFPALLEEEGAEKLLEGMAIAKGKQFSPVGTEDACLIVLKDKRAKIIGTEELKDYGGKIETAIGAWNVRGLTGLMVTEGKVNPDLVVDELAARTAVGLSRDEKTLYMVVAEGGPRYGNFFHKDEMSEGVYLHELARFMIELGCYKAINLDGGGASTMVIEDSEKNPLLLNIPSDYRPERERAVGSLLGIYAKPLKNRLGKLNLQKLKLEMDYFFMLRDSLRDEGVASVNHYIDSTMNGVKYGDLGALLNKKVVKDHCENGEDINNLDINDLQKVGGKPGGKSKGGVYKDAQGLVWFIKKGQNPATEYIASKLLKMLLGDRTGDIKLVHSEDEWGLTAARQMLDFKPKSSIDKLLEDTSEENKELREQIHIIGEAELAMIMDFIGLGDRHNGNLGYIPLGDDGKLITARIDYDHAFFFDANKHPRDPQELFLVNPESRKYFAESIIQHGLGPSKRALRSIKNVPDTQIEAVLKKAINEYYSINGNSDKLIEQYEDLPKALIVRKHMLKELIKHIEVLEAFIAGQSFSKEVLEESIEYIFSDKNGLMAYAASMGDKLLAFRLMHKYQHTFNYETNYGSTPLHIAIEKEQNEFLKLILDTEVDINQQDKHLRTPLYYASRLGNLKAVELLLQQNAELEARDELGRAPIHAAVANQNEEIVSILLEKGADINALCDHGKPPIFYTLKDARIAMLELLIDRGAGLEIQDIHGRSPLHIAAQHNQYEVLKKLILQGVNINAQDKQERTALFHATAKGYFNCVMPLVLSGADTSIGNVNGFTPIHMAAGGATKNLKTLQYFINELKLNVNSLNKQKQTPLMLSAKKGYLDLATYLIKNSASLSQEDVRGQTALHFAARTGKKDVVKYLIRQGAAVNIADKNGQTPLFSAVVSNNADVVKHLVNQGADVKVVDHLSRSALHFAASKGNLEIVRHLIAQGANKNVMDSKHRTALFNAVANGHIEVVKLLVDSSKDAQLQDITGLTPLDFAIKRGYPEILQFLSKTTESKDVEAASESASISLNQHKATEPNDFQELEESAVIAD